MEWSAGNAWFRQRNRNRSTAGPIVTAKIVLRRLKLRSNMDLDAITNTSDCVEHFKSILIQEVLGID